MGISNGNLHREFPMGISNGQVQWEFPVGAFSKDSNLWESLNLQISPKIRVCRLESLGGLGPTEAVEAWGVMSGATQATETVCKALKPLSLGGGLCPHSHFLRITNFREPSHLQISTKIRILANLWIYKSGFLRVLGSTVSIMSDAWQAKDNVSWARRFFNDSNLWKSLNLDPPQLVLGNPYACAEKTLPAVRNHHECAEKQIQFNDSVGDSVLRRPSQQFLI